MVKDEREKFGIVDAGLGPMSQVSRHSQRECQDSAKPDEREDATYERDAICKATFLAYVHG